MPNLRLIYYLIQFISLSACLDEGSFGDNDYNLALEQELSEGFVGNSDASAVVTKAPKVTPKIAAKSANSTTTLTAVTGTPGLLVTPVLEEINCKNISSDLLNTDPDQCCLGPTVFQEELLYNCQLKNNHRADWFYDDPPDNECVVQCLFESMNLTTDNKTIVKDRLINETLSQRTKDRAIWEPIVIQSIDECLKPERAQVNATGPIVCNPYFYVTLHCFFVQMFKNCPSTHVVNTQKCAVLRSFAQKCDTIPKHRVYHYN